MLSRMLVGLLIAGSGCGGGPVPVLAPERVFLSEIEHLVRASVAVRGTRPSLDELSQVEADPDALPALVDVWLQSPEFGETIRDLHAEMLLVRADTLPQFPALGALAGLSLAEVHASVSEEPLRLAEDIVLSDRPYTEILTADWMWADRTLAKIYGLPFDPDGPVLQLSWWTDGRPAAGLLSSSELFHRHASNGNNFHRGRANLIASTFLCDDISQRPIEIVDPPVVTEVDEVTEAIATNPACGGCHQALEPIASFLWGYKPVLPNKVMNSFLLGDCEEVEFNLELLPAGAGFAEDVCYPLRLYSPAEERVWEELGLPHPALYGSPGERVSDLGALIIDDPRFAACSARRFYAYLTQVDPEGVDPGLASALGQDLVDSGYSVRSLVRQVVLSDTFRTARGDGSDPDAGLLTVRPEQYARTIEALTRFRWIVEDTVGCGTKCWGAVDLARSDVFGFRALSGGSDGIRRTSPTHTATPTKLLAMTRFAAEAADFAVLDGVLLDGTITDRTAVRVQIGALRRRVLQASDDPDAPQVDALLALFDDAVARRGDPAAGWKLVLTALLTDPEMIHP